MLGGFAAARIASSIFHLERKSTIVTAQNVRIRGNAPQVYEKYLSLARDATSAGDRVGAESYFQFAEHYFRIMNDTTDPQRPNLDANRQRQARPNPGGEQPHVEWPESGAAGNGHDRTGPGGQPAAAPDGAATANRQSEAGPKSDEGAGQSGDRSESAEAAAPQDHPSSAPEAAVADAPAEESPPPESAAAESPTEEPDAPPRRGRPRTKRAAGTAPARKTATKTVRRSKPAKTEEPAEAEGESTEGGDSKEASA